MEAEKDFTPKQDMRGNVCSGNILEAIAKVVGVNSIIEFAVWQTVLIYLGSGTNTRQKIMAHLEIEVDKWVKET